MTTDLFSKQAALYSLYRPQYPRELYEFLVGQTEKKDLAWDCATGSGQAAVDLARYYAKVIATDLSEKQIANAISVPNVNYKVLRAEERLILQDHSLDLVTVAQALHWFDTTKFYDEVKRLLKPNGIFATWAYSFHEPIQSEIDVLLKEFHFETLEPFWKSNNKLVWDNYKNLSFPFNEIETPELTMKVDWSLDDLMGYFKTWSSTQLFIDKYSTDPTVGLKLKILPHWGNAHAPRTLTWKLTFRAGKPV